jgi:hypothetical protein
MKPRILVAGTVMLCASVIFAISATESHSVFFQVIAVVVLFSGFVLFIAGLGPPPEDSDGGCDIPPGGPSLWG